MRYFFDTEFLEDGRTIDLISIGIVAEDGREYYAVSRDANWANVFASEWLVDNVIPHLPIGKVRENNAWSWSNHVQLPFAEGQWLTRKEIKKGILDFVGDDDKPEFWAYYADYDWVALCQLYGRMIDLPRGWPMFCRDLKQVLCNLKLRPPEQTNGVHNALADARWVRKTFDWCAWSECGCSHSKASERTVQRD